MLLSDTSRRLQLASLKICKNKIDDNTDSLMNEVEAIFADADFYLEDAGVYA